MTRPTCSGENHEEGNVSDEDPLNRWSDRLRRYAIDGQVAFVRGKTGWRVTVCVKAAGEPDRFVTVEGSSALSALRNLEQRLLQLGHEARQ